MPAPPCCENHVEGPGCCDPEDCTPCCNECPTCPSAHRMHTMAPLRRSEDRPRPVRR